MSVPFEPLTEWTHALSIVLMRAISGLFARATKYQNFGAASRAILKNIAEGDSAILLFDY